MVLFPMARKGTIVATLIEQVNDVNLQQKLCLD